MNCKIYGGTCGVGGFCEDCPHKDHSEDVLDMVEEKPLDRGKVCDFLDEMSDADFGEGYGLAHGYHRAIDDILEAINSGRLDVEEG